MRASRFYTMGCSALLLAAAVTSCAQNAGTGSVRGGGGEEVAKETTAPVVTSRDPADLAKNVPINQKITAVFSKKMAPESFTSTTFTLMSAKNNLVDGEVSCNGTTAMFTPAKTLAPNTVFTATINAGVKDMLGYTLAKASVWTFQTGELAATSQGSVNLGTSDKYVILAKTGVSTTGTTKINGDIGLSPGTGKMLTGFSTNHDKSDQWAGSSFVDGKVYAADCAAPTPATLSTAVLDMQTAYREAAERNTPDSKELGGGNIDAMILAPGLYNWTTSVKVANGVTLDGGPDAVWIFQIGQDLKLADGAIITLTGGAQIKNVFWQVAGKTTLGAKSNFKGILLCQKEIEFQAASVLNGRALSQTGVKLDGAIITAP